MRLYSGSGRRLSGKKGGKRLAGGRQRLRSKGLGLAPVAGMLAIACCLGGLLWCVRAGFPNRPAQQAEKAYEMLDTIDTNIFKKLNDEQKDDIRNRLDQIQEVLNRIRGELDA